MGLFDKKTTKNVSHIDESVTQGDIGLTGKNAVDMVAYLELGAIEREQIISDTIVTLNQQIGSGYNQLIGGAGLLIETADKIGQMNTAQQGIIAQSGLEAIKEISKTERALKGVEDINFQNALPYLMIALFAGFLFYG